MDLDWNQSSTSRFVVVLSHSQVLISPTGTFAEHISIIGYYRTDVELCFAYTVPAYGLLWVPSFTFDAILAILAFWAGIQHSRRQYSRLLRFSKPQLVDTLIQGNVVYFIRYAVGRTY